MINLKETIRGLTIGVTIINAALESLNEIYGLKEVNNEKPIEEIHSDKPVKKLKVKGQRRGSGKSFFKRSGVLTDNEDLLNLRNKLNILLQKFTESKIARLTGLSSAVINRIKNLKGRPRINTAGVLNKFYTDNIKE